LRAEIVQGVLRQDAQVALLVPDLVPQVRALLTTRVPVGLDAVDAIERASRSAVEAHVVEHEELRLRPEVAGVREPRAPQVFLRLGGDVSGIARVLLTRDGVLNRALERERRVARERI